MFAIVDIETTGGSPDNCRITEIAILRHDGKQVVDQFSTLINPQCKIPYQITQLTGIDDKMVANAPFFHEVAKKILELTEDAVFVAHNVRFDYSFVRAAYKSLGYNYERKTLCTVKLSRQAFAGLPSYSLGNLCTSLNLPIKNRHRALGDAEATVLLFDKIINTNVFSNTPEGLATEIKKTNLPPLLPEEVLAGIPESITGVYYFYNKVGDVIYVGKSNDIRKRLLQHFINQKTKKSVRMLHDIADISFENTGCELTALLLESDEIKRLKPTYNHSQKRSSQIPYYSIYQKTDGKGYVNLFIDRYSENKFVLATADNMHKAKRILNSALEKHSLCQAKCDLHNYGGACFNFQIKKCNGACTQKELPEEYNRRAMAAIESFSFQSKSFFLIGNGRNVSEKSVVCIEKGQYKGFGYIDTQFEQPTAESLRHCIKKYPHNQDIQTILARFMDKRVRIDF